MKRIFFTFILLVATPFSTLSLANDVRYYDFEIIIFESLDEESKISEAWKNNVSIEPPETFVTLGHPYPGPMPKEYIPKHTFKLLPRNTYRLAEDAKLLEANEQYRILLHTAWRQPGMTAQTTLPIRLHKEFIVTQKTQESAVSAGDSDPEVPASNLSDPNIIITKSKAILDGYLKIVLSRYLHANYDLVYKTGLPLSGEAKTVTVNSEEDAERENLGKPIEPLIVSYQLQQTRKMRSKEVHYIDNPAIGIIMLAWPYKGDDLKSN